MADNQEINWQAKASGKHRARRTQVLALMSLVFQLETGPRISLFGVAHAGASFQLAPVAIFPAIACTHCQRRGNTFPSDRLFLPGRRHKSL